MFIVNQTGSSSEVSMLSCSVVQRNWQTCKIRMIFFKRNDKAGSKQDRDCQRSQMLTKQGMADKKKRSFILWLVVCQKKKKSCWNKTCTKWWRQLSITLELWRQKSDNRDKLCFHAKMQSACHVTLDVVPYTKEYICVNNLFSFYTECHIFIYYRISCFLVIQNIMYSFYKWCHVFIYTLMICSVYSECPVVQTNTEQKS